MEQPTPNPVGRPSKYTEEVLEKARAYAKNHLVDGSDDVIPSIEGLSIYLGVSRETVRDWAKQSEKAEFSAIVEEMMAKQARALFNGALRGELREKTSSMMLSKHGYSEKQEVDLSSSDGSMRPTVIELVAP
jgi:hypothetical protein